jgi:predicted transcriptional regulator
MFKDILEDMILFILKIAMVKHLPPEKIMYSLSVLERSHLLVYQNKMVLL